MSNNSPTTMGVGKRVTILDSVGTTGDHSNGQSLRGQNVQNFPSSSLFYVRDSNRMYRLKKNMAVAIVEDGTGMCNVVNGIGSSAENGRFVALEQMGFGSLTGGESGGTVTIAGWDVNPDGYFHVTHVTLEGTPGFLMAGVASETTVTVTSSSDTDTSDVFVTYYQTPEAE